MVTKKRQARAGTKARAAGKARRKPSTRKAKTRGRSGVRGAPRTDGKRVVATGSGGAGRRGDDVRSDLWVSIERRRSGGLVLDVESKVEAFYGESLRRTVQGALAAYRVTNARVRVEDKGALPFVVSARLETALRRSGATGDARPARTVPVPPDTARDRVRRSRLYLPGNEPKFMINAGIHKADAVILDLEDSVHPEQKDAARLLVRNALRCVDFMGAERMVRINQLPLGLSDIDEVVPESPDLILLPKAETAEQVREVDEHIRRVQRRARVKHTVWLMPILESALGIERAYEIAAASDRVVALTIGLEDYTADLGVKKTSEGAESHFARSRMVNAARAAGVQAIDSVYGDVGDIDGLRSWGRRSHAMGFEGMGCIHPRQIRVVHEAYAPSADEIERALKIVAAFEEAKRQGLGVVSVGSRMVDPPVVLRAQRLVSAARRAGLIDEDAV